MISCGRYRTRLPQVFLEIEVQGKVASRVGPIADAAPASPCNLLRRAAPANRHSPDRLATPIHVKRTLVQKEPAMAKGQKHGNREAKKPKQLKLAHKAAAGGGLLERAAPAASPGTRKTS